MRRWYPLLLVVVAIAASAMVYPQLPDRVPTHWNAHGQVNGYSSKAFAAGFMPVLLLAMWGILRLLPTIDPRRENYAKFQSTYDLVVNTVLTLVLVIHLGVLAAARGRNVAFTRLLPAAVGVMFIVMGYAMPRARPNWWFGIRTPWTLSNDRVWERTHRVGGYLFVALGVASVASALLPSAVAFGVVGVLGAATSLATVIYSYVVWKQETSR